MVPSGSDLKFCMHGNSANGSPFMISQILHSGSTRHWPSMQHMYVTHVDGGVHIAWLSLLPRFSVALYKERRNNGDVIEVCPFAVRLIQLIWWLWSLIFSPVSIAPCLQVTRKSNKKNDDHNTKILWVCMVVFTAGGFTKAVGGTVDCECWYSLCFSWGGLISEVDSEPANISFYFA